MKKRYIYKNKYFYNNKLHKKFNNYSKIIHIKYKREQ